MPDVSSGLFNYPRIPALLRSDDQSLISQQRVQPAIAPVERPSPRDAVVPGLAGSKSKVPGWRPESDHRDALHEINRPQEVQEDDDFDFRAQPNKSCYARRIEPWSVYSSATDSGPTRSSITSLALQRDLTEASPFTDDVSLHSGPGVDHDYNSQSHQPNVGDLTFGLESPVYQRKQGGVGPTTTSNGDEAKSAQKSQTAAPARSRSKKHPCPQCDKVLNCKSDLVKHTRWHDKPFRCDVQGCERSEGFITQNDLDRHKKSKHFNGLYGKTRSFQCVGQHCKRPQKVWPRLDNFRSHVSKMHPDENVEDVVKRSEIVAPSKSNGQLEVATSIDPSETTVGPPRVTITQETDESSSRSESTAEQRSSPAPIAANQPPLHVLQPDHPSQNHSTPNAGLDALSTAAVMSAPALPIHNVPNIPPTPPPHTDAVQMAVNAFMSIIQQSQMAVSPQNHMNVPSSQRGPSNSSLSHTTAQPALPSPAAPNQKAVVIDALERMLLTLKRDEPAVEPVQAAVPVAETANKPPAETGQTCHICKKYLKRNCDMNKHLKRHTKPYGCTFAECDKVFGSKNDWKRHENSQHFQGEFYKCQQSYPGEKFDKCSYMTQDESTMERHLIEMHLLSTDAAKGQLTISHVGRNHQSRFWCGFCGDVVRLDNQGVQAWDERFNHIDKHFMKEKRRVDEWVDPETYKTKGQMAEDDAERKRQREAAEQTRHEAPPNGFSGPRKRAGSALSRDSHMAKQSKPSSSGANIFVTCCHCDEGTLLSNSPAQCTFCGKKWCDECPKEVLK